MNKQRRDGLHGELSESLSVRSISIRSSVHACRGTASLENN